MLIGDLAKRTGASPKAIRLYEARGLLSRVSRQGAYRVYTEEHFQQVRLIRQAQALGFSLSEFGSLANEQSEPDWEKVLQQLDDKRASIREEMRSLAQLEAQIAQVQMELQTCLVEMPSPDVAACEDTRRPALASQSRLA
ncbi:MAG: transcriptional regulator [unclassified Hahellaceae]|nr:transcriptional regulator [Hahellaceae bacterium]|tara:strand:+ start:22535 stop:22954 length:420 start_codon:yes stop_codon:yes gene_type:complete